VKAAEPKDRWTQITDQAEREALMLCGKWREDRPTTVRRADTLWALVDERFIAWREARANTGKRL
jgi:hypothetical protein